VEFLQIFFFNSCATLSQQNENAGPGCHGDFAVIAGGHWYVLSVSLSVSLSRSRLVTQLSSFCALWCFVSGYGVFEFCAEEK